MSAKERIEKLSRKIWIGEMDETELIKAVIGRIVTNDDFFSEVQAIHTRVKLDKVANLGNRK